MPKRTWRHPIKGEPTPTEIRLAGLIRLVEAYAELAKAYREYAEAELEVIKLAIDLYEILGRNEEEGNHV